MKGFPFWKMSGSGNDFILMDHREVPWHAWDLSEMAKKICRRRLSVGADGLIVLVPPADPENDFAWRFLNADGSEAEMCGNGARCAARFAHEKGLAPSRMRFETLAGVIEAELMGEKVRLLMIDLLRMPESRTVRASNQDLQLTFVNTGVPHVVMFVGDSERMEVLHLGRAIRYHPDFAPSGTNVNFVQIVEPQTLKIRTYERGVEDETLACGTGAVASALAAHFLGSVQSPVDVITRSGRRLSIFFESGVDSYGPVYLEGDAQWIYEGSMLPDAYE